MWPLPIVTAPEPYEAGFTYARSDPSVMIVNVFAEGESRVTVESAELIVQFTTSTISRHPSLRVLVNTSALWQQRRPVSLC